MTYPFLHIILAVVILVVALPYVARIRHPSQHLLAAYLIFTSVFFVTAMILFSLFGWIAARLDLAGYLSEPGPGLILLMLVFVPAFALASWQARKPSWREGPPK